MKVFLFLLILITLTIEGFSQSPFKRQPKINAPEVTRFLSRAVTGISSTDTIINAWRFGVVVPAYAVTSANTFTNAQAMAGGEFGYKHQRFTFSTQQYNTVWSVNLAWFALNTATPPTSITGIQTFAILGGYSNDLIQAGPMYNPQAPKGQKFGAAVSIGIALH